MQEWVILMWTDVESWLVDLDEDTYIRVAAAIDLLSIEGPTLGRPLVDRVSGSRHHNMKELRPTSSGGNAIRILFAFDPRRQAVLLLAGNKAGTWHDWYVRNIPVADDRFDAWLEGLEEMPDGEASSDGLARGSS